ncbi:sugar-binding transcriptional regulator [Polycladidibacter stylochi]|uniref:sugar-binding transcriptional regulator n=1 Tax=Polycladidibacter stylochi TaxID=1807766 RepID=UPI00082A1A26|nr:sugar-binding transcriptional regulator [Pseudovibrio stylochi]
MSRASRSEQKLEQAARAAWLYYVVGDTQDQVAAKLNVSRQAAQRLVSLAVSEKLIKFRLDHPIASCVELERKLQERFELQLCEIVPTAEGGHTALGGLAVAVADHMEDALAITEPTVIGVSTGRSLRAAVEEVPHMECPNHKVVALVGAMSREGQSSHFEIAGRLADKAKAQCYPMPTPVVTSSVEERELMQGQRFYKTIEDLAKQAAICFVGVCEIAWNCPLQSDGFLTGAEIIQLADNGAVGEIAGWTFDRAGNVLDNSINDRVTGIHPSVLAERKTIAVGSGAHKIQPILGALRGKIANGLISDEATARALLAAS